MTPPEDELDARIDAAQARQRAREGKGPGGTPRGGAQGMAAGIRVLVDLLAGVAVGGFLGYGFDRWRDSSPWGLIVFLMLGFAAGIVNVQRTAREMELAAKRRKEDEAEDV